MDEAARRAPELTRPTWIMARAQTKGRGRLARTWSQTDGNFAASLVMFPGDPAKVAGWRSFLAAVAVAETLDSLGVAPDRLRLKWPNDVILDRGKVAGILLESSLSGDTVERLTIGIGVNLASAPLAEDGKAIPPVSVAGAGGPAIEPDAFLDRLAQVMARWNAVFDSEGYVPIRKAWEGRVAHTGDVTIRSGKRKVTGLFIDLDQTGRIVLHDDKGLHYFAAGDISFKL